MTSEITGRTPLFVLDPPPEPPAAPERWRFHPGEVLAAVGLGAAVVGAWPVLLMLRSGLPLEPFVMIAHVCGMLAGYGVIVLLTLMSRAPALEHGVGADVLTRWHSRGGRIVVLLVLAHGYAAVAAWASAHRESVMLALRDVLGFPGLVTATVGTLFLVAVGGVSIRAVRRRLPYEVWHSVHLLTYVGLALGFSHQLAGPDLAGHRVLQVLWALLYTQAFALLLVHRVITPLRQASRHHLRVSRVREEGPGVISIEVEGDHLHELQAEAGHFFRWRFLTTQNWLTAHPFSLSAPPSAHALRLTVKSLGTGSASLQGIQVGTRVLAEGPYGAMTAARRTRLDVLLVAGGVGITPMRALLETMPLAPGRRLTLLYRARTLDDVLFRTELEDIAWRRGATIRYLLGHDPDCLSAQRLARLVPGLAGHDVYLCGPPRMAQAARRGLLGAGLPTRQLHEERFAF